MGAGASSPEKEALVLKNISDEETAVKDPSKQAEMQQTASTETEKSPQTLLQELKRRNKEFETQQLASAETEASLRNELHNLQVKYEALLALHTQPAHIKTTTASIAPAVKERIVIRGDTKAIKRRASHGHPSQSLGKNAGRALVQANSPKLKPKSKLARRNSLQFMANNTASQPMTSSAVTQLKNSGMGTDTSASFSTRQLKDRFDILNIKNNNGKTQAAKKQRTKVGIILFTGFELLDAFGPMEMFGLLTRLQVNQTKRRFSTCVCCSPSLFLCL
jgi:hypothetical protein